MCGIKASPSAGLKTSARNQSERDVRSECETPTCVCIYFWDGRSRILTASISRSIIASVRGARARARGEESREQVFLYLSSRNYRRARHKNARSPSVANKVPGFTPRSPLSFFSSALFSLSLRAALHNATGR